MNLTTLIVASIACNAPKLNDGYWVTIGDAQRFGSSDQVRLVTETLRIDLDDGYMNVDVAYQFQNEGGSTTVTMAFPEGCSNGAVRMRYEDFRSWVGGVPVIVVREVLKKDAYDDSYDAIWKKRVYFRANQTRKVKVQYRMPMGADNSGGSGGTYVLTTGATWKGTIKRLDVIVDWSKQRLSSKPTLDSIPFTQTSATSAKCSLLDVEPRNDIGLHRVDGFFNFSLNGKELRSSLCPTMPRVLFEDGSLLFPLEDSPRRYQHWLGELLGTFVEDDVEAWSHPALRRFANKMTINEDGTILDGNGRRYRMRRAPVIREVPVYWDPENVRYVYFRDFVEALGGTCDWNSRLRRVEFQL